MCDIFPIMARYTSTIYPVKKVVNLTAEQAQRIRGYRFAEKIDSENEAIRRLIEAGLKARQVDAPSGGSTPGAAKKPAAGKSAPAPKTKALPMSKEAQIRALREEGASDGQSRHQSPTGSGYQRSLLADGAGTASSLALCV
jgi:hypothetical protein